MNPLALLSGIVIGFVQGLIAGGGSVLGVPALIYVVGVKARISPSALARSRRRFRRSPAPASCRPAIHKGAGVDHREKAEEVALSLW